MLQRSGFEPDRIHLLADPLAGRQSLMSSHLTYNALVRYVAHEGAIVKVKAGRRSSLWRTPNLMHTYICVCESCPCACACACACTCTCADVEPVTVRYRPLPSVTVPLKDSRSYHQCHADRKTKVTMKPRSGKAHLTWQR